MNARKTRVEEAKAIGRAAYRLVRNATTVGYIDTTDGRKLIREWRSGRVSIELRAAADVVSRADQFSDLRMRVEGRKVLDLSWNERGAFIVAAFERGGWEQSVDCLHAR